MGQGFAHQIFVVFANAHPEIVIEPYTNEVTVSGGFLCYQKNELIR